MRKLLAFAMLAAIAVGCAKEETPAAPAEGAVGEGKAGAQASGAPPAGLRNGGQDIQPGGKVGG